MLQLWEYLFDKTLKRRGKIETSLIFLLLLFQTRQTTSLTTERSLNMNISSHKLTKHVQILDLILTWNLLFVDWHKIKDFVCKIQAKAVWQIWPNQLQVKRKGCEDRNIKCILWTGSKTAQHCCFSISENASNKIYTVFNTSNTFLKLIFLIEKSLFWLKPWWNIFRAKPHSVCHSLEVWCWNWTRRLICGEDRLLGRGEQGEEGAPQPPFLQ